MQGGRPDERPYTDAEKLRRAGGCDATGCRYHARGKAREAQRQ
jgi:hypothetical protein